MSVYRYTFPAAIAFEDVEGCLLLAVLATESLHGESQVQLDVGHFFDPARRVGVIDAGTQAGRNLNRIFTGFLRREFPGQAFQVERLADAPATTPVGAPA